MGEPKRVKWYVLGAVFVCGLLIGAYLSAWQGPSNTNECIMSQLGGMQSNTAAEYLFIVCEDRFGRL
jgi:hypothetical protein